jgi:hypothetical protein
MRNPPEKKVPTGLLFTDRVIIKARDRLKSARKRLRFSATTMRLINRALSSRRGLAAFAVHFSPFASTTTIMNESGFAAGRAFAWAGRNSAVGR